jgi:hypothetical protein
MTNDLEQTQTHLIFLIPKSTIQRIKHQKITPETPTPNHHTSRWRPTTIRCSNNHQPSTPANHNPPTTNNNLPDPNHNKNPKTNHHPHATLSKSTSSSPPQARSATTPYRREGRGEK